MDAANTRHLAVCGPGGQTSIGHSGGKLKRLPGPVCPVFAPGPSADLYTRHAGEGQILIARQPSKWWAVALWSGTAAVCASCGTAECLERLSNVGWMELTRGGNLRTFSPSTGRTVVDDWVEASLSAHARGDPAPSEVLYRLDANQLRDLLEQLV